jgi:hypothetical protein
MLKKDLPTIVFPSALLAQNRLLIAGQSWNVLKNEKLLRKLTATDRDSLQTKSRKAVLLSTLNATQKTKTVPLANDEHSKKTKTHERQVLVKRNCNTQNLPRSPFVSALPQMKRTWKTVLNKCKELLINSQYFKKRKELAAVGIPIQRKGQEIEFTNTHWLKFWKEIKKVVSQTVHLETKANRMLLNKCPNQRNTF